MKSLEERRWICIFIALVVVVTTIPYYIGFDRQGTDWVFNGFVFGVEDGNSYIAKMLSGSVGNWLFRTPYTTFPQRGFLAFLPYLLLGKLSAAPGMHDQLVVLFQFFRWVGVAVYILATYDFIECFTEDVRLRKIGTVLASLSGGFGWLAILGVKFGGYQGLPLEFYSPESFGFLSIFGLPHLAVGRALLLWGLREYLFPSREQKPWDWIAPGVLWLLLGLMQPLTIVTGWAVIAMHLLLVGGFIWVETRHFRAVWAGNKEFFWRAVGMIVISSPLVLYNFIRFQTDAYLNSWQSQNLILSPPLLDYLMAYGILLPLVVIGGVAVIRKRMRIEMLLLGWVLVFPLLAYAPYNLQRRLPEGIWAALIALGCLGYGWLKVKSHFWLWIGVAISLFSTLLVFAGGVIAVGNPGPPLYRPIDEVRAFQYLAETASPGEVVLAEYATANALPAWAPLRVVIGHGPESMQLAQVQPRVEKFFAHDLTKQEEIELLREFKVGYVLDCPKEQIGESIDGLGFDHSSLVYRNQRCFIYRVD